MRWFARPLSGFLSVVFAGFLIVGAALAYMEVGLPDVSVLKDMHMQVPLRVYTADGQLMARYGAKQRVPVRLHQIPLLLSNAVLAVEDARYYDHPGVDLVGLARAAKAVLLSGRKVQGASTITMQVARNFFLTRKKTYSRKVREILLALKIDRNLSKDKVLELYLNKVYFGRRAYGVAAAAQVYYDKPLNELTLAQMAMMAGLPQAPSRNNPISNPKQALKRRNHVLDRMLEVGFIDQAQHDEAIVAPVTAQNHGLKIAFHAPYVAELVRQTMIREYGDQAYDLGLNVVTTIRTSDQRAAQQALQTGLEQYSQRHGYRGPLGHLSAVDSIDREVWLAKLDSYPSQPRMRVAAIVAVADKQAQALLADGSEVTIPWAGLSWAAPAQANGFAGKAPSVAGDVVAIGDVVWLAPHDQQWWLTQLPVVQGAEISLDPKTGSILSLVGGYQFAASKFNRVTQALRQPGSSFKPFVYSAALDKGYTLASIINDAPVVMQDSGENALWRPHNDNLKFYGPTRLRTGLVKSRNLVSIRLLQQIGVPYAIDYVSRFGFDPNKLPNSLSLALGSASVTPLQLATGYAVFANGGYRIVPHFIQQVTNQNQDVLYRAHFGQVMTQERGDAIPIGTDPVASAAAPQVVTKENAYLVTDALQGVIQQGTGRAAKVLKRSDLAGKTGTTNKQADAWFAGYNRDVLSVVWVGFDNLTSLHEYGSKAALPIWIDYMRAALAGQPMHALAVPPGVVTVRIDPSNGLLARSDQNNAVFESFRATHQPQQYSADGESSQAQVTGAADAVVGSGPMVADPLF